MGKHREHTAKPKGANETAAGEAGGRETPRRMPLSALGIRVAQGLDHVLRSEPDCLSVGSRRLVSRARADTFPCRPQAEWRTPTLFPPPCHSHSVRDACLPAASWHSWSHVLCSTGH